MTLRCRTHGPFPWLCALLIAAPVAAQAQDWPQWRGPSRDGAVPAFEAPEAWPESLTLRWRVDVGEGYAAPVLVGERVYAFTREGGDEVMRALDADTGAELWRAAYPAPFSFLPAAEPHGPGPKATPTHAGGRLYTLGLGGVVTAFDAETGDAVWRVPEPEIAPWYGTAASPLVDGGAVVVHVGGHDQGALTAFDSETGEVRWAWDGDGPSYASPQLVEVDGVRQIVTLTQGKVVGVQAATGALLWERAFSTNFTQNIIDPIVVDGGTVVISGFQEPTQAFRLARAGDGWTIEDAWASAETSQYMTNGVLLGDGRLFGMTSRNSGQYFLLDLAAGETLWTSAPRQAENAAILRAGDTLLVLEDDGELVVGRVSDGGFDEAARYVVAGSATWAQPAVAGNRVFVKDVTTLSLWTID